MSIVKYKHFTMFSIKFEIKCFKIVLHNKIVHMKINLIANNLYLDMTRVDCQIKIVYKILISK